MAESDNEQGTASGGEGAGTTTVNHTETADDAETPEEADKLLPWQAYVNIVKGNVGPGCLSMPYTFAEGGLVPSLLILLVFAPACIYCMNLLVFSKHRLLASHAAAGVSPAKLNFEEVGAYALGPMGGRLIEVFVCCTQLGVCAIFFDFCSINLHAVFPNVSPQHFMLGLIPVVSGMVMVRSAKGIVGFSTAATVLMAAALLGVFGYVLQNMHGELRHGTMQSFGRISKLPLVFGNLAFAFEGIGLVLPVESAMQESKRFRFPAVLTAAMATVALIFLLNGLLCYIALGQIESASITATLAHRGLHQGAVAALNLLVMLAVLLTFPLQFLPSLQILEKAARLERGHGTPLEARWRGEPQKRAPTGESEATRLIHDADSPAGYSAGFSVLEARPQVADVVLEDHGLKQLDCERAMWMPFRVLLVVLTAAFAFSVPNLGVLMSLVGAVCSTTLGLILPPIIHWRLCGAGYTRGQYVLHGALTGLGVVGGGLAFVASFRQLIFHGSEDGR